MNLRVKRRYLAELVEAKNASFPPLTDAEKALGFLGWHERGAPAPRESDRNSHARSWSSALQNTTNLRVKRRYLAELVEAKNASFLPLTDAEKALGLLGWHERGAPAP